MIKKHSLKYLLASLLALGLGTQAKPSELTHAEILSEITQGLVGRIGVAAQLIGGPEAISVNGDAYFPMASTFKIALAATLLHHVDLGKLRLEQTITVSPDMLIAGGGSLSSDFVHPGIHLSLANLIEIMITHSDNTATDIGLKLVGGPAAVTARLRALGITGQRVDRYVAQGIQDFYELTDLATKANIWRLRQQDPHFTLSTLEPNANFERDPRDQTTPKAMLELLLAIENGEALEPASRDFLMGAMSRTKTSPGRIKGLLPRGALVAHKSGSLGGIANDVGYITLPDGRRLVIAVFTSSSTSPLVDRDRAIADVSRTIYDYFLMQPTDQP